MAILMLIDSFLDYLRFERNYSDKTIVSYGVDLSQCEDFVRRADEELSLEKADTDLIRQWMVDLMEQGYTASSVNRKLSSLRTFFKFLLSRGIVVVDPVRKINGPKKKKPLPTFLKESEMDKLLDEVEYGDGFEGVRDRMVIEMFYATGIRCAELVGLRDVDVDFSTSVIKVTGKRNKQRLIPFGDELAASMRTYIKVRDEAFPEKYSNAFFLKKSGRELCNGTVYELVRKHLSKVVTLKKRSPHVLRHTFATTMLNNDAQLGAVKEILGHASLSSTEVYTHTTFEELKKVYKQAHPRA